MSAGVGFLPAVGTGAKWRAFCRSPCRRHAERILCASGVRKRAEIDAGHQDKLASGGSCTGRLQCAVGLAECAAFPANIAHVASLRQDNRAPLTVQKDSLAFAPSDASHENQTAQPIFPPPSGRSIARNFGTLLPVWSEARTGMGRVPQKASRKAKTRSKRAVALLGGVGQRKEIGLHRDFVRQSFVKPPAARFYAYDAQDKFSTLRENAPRMDTFALGLNYSGASSALSAREAEDTTGGKSAYGELSQEPIASTNLPKTRGSLFRCGTRGGASRPV